MTGSINSEYPVANSKPSIYKSHFSATPGSSRWARTSGDVSTGKPITKVGVTNVSLATCSKISSANLPAIHFGSIFMPRFVAIPTKSEIGVNAVTF